MSACGGVARALALFCATHRVLTPTHARRTKNVSVLKHTDRAGAVLQSEMALTGETDMAKLKALSAKPYKDQAVWFMNAYWDKFYKPDEKARETLWSWTQIFIQLDPKKKKGCELNEFDAHRFLERIGETLSVRDMREFLRSVDIDFNKMVSLTEYLVSKHKVDWKALIHAPQDDAKGKAERAAAQRLVNEAKAAAELAVTNAASARENETASIKATKQAAERALVANSEEKKATAAAQRAAEREKKAKDDEATAESKRAEALAAESKAKLSESHAHDTAAKAAEEEAAAKAKESALQEAELQAKAKANDAKAAEAESQKAAAEVKAALDRVMSEERKYEARKAKLSAESKNMSLGVVKRNRSANQLEQLKNKPTLGLQTAKVTLTAAEKKAKRAAGKSTRAAKNAQAAVDKISQAKTAAEAARKSAEGARGVADADAKAATATREAAVASREAAQDAVIVATDAKTKAEKARRAAQAAQGKAEAARKESEAALKRSQDAKAAATRSRQAAEASLKSAKSAFEEAAKKLKDLLSKPRGSGQGANWWLQREFEEAKKYMPKAKIRHLSQTKGSGAPSGSA